MMTFGVTMQVKNMFFDREEVIREVGKMNAKALSKIGAFVRRRASSSMRRRKKASAPGTPPSAHSSGFASLKNILFAYDRANQSVVIGPVRLNAMNFLGGMMMSGTVPQLHEFGGTAGIREKKVGTHWRSIGRRKARPGQPTRVRRARYPARPFMGPALDAEIPNFPSLWVSSAGGRAA